MIIFAVRKLKIIDDIMVVRRFTRAGSRSVVNGNYKTGNCLDTSCMLPQAKAEEIEATYSFFLMLFISMNIVAV